MCLYIVLFFEGKSRLKPSLRSNLQAAYCIKAWRKSCTKEVIWLATSKCSPNVVANKVVLARSHAILPIDKSWTNAANCDRPHLMPWTHQTFHPASTVNLSGFMLRNRCGPITFHTIAAGDVVDCGPPHLVPQPHQTFRPAPTVNLLGFMLRNRCGPTIFHTIAVGDVVNCGCPHLMPRSHQPFHPTPTAKLLWLMLRNRCCPTIFHTIAVGDVDGWCQFDQPLSF